MRVFFILIFVLLAQQVFGQNYGQKLTDATLRLQQLRTSNANIVAISADFSMFHTTPLLSAPQKGVGQMIYQKKADLLTLDYTQPQGDKLTIEKGTITIKSAGKTIETDASQAQHIVSMFKACFTGNFDKLGNKSDLEYYQDKTYFTIIIKPRNGRLKRLVKQMTLQFDTDDKLSLMRIEAGNGDCTEYRYTNQIITKN